MQTHQDSKGFRNSNAKDRRAEEFCHCVTSAARCNGGSFARRAGYWTLPPRWTSRPAWHVKRINLFDWPTTILRYLNYRNTGENNYKINLPANIPAANFWSIALSEAENASDLANGQPFPHSAHATSPRRTPTEAPTSTSARSPRRQGEQLDGNPGGQKLLRRFPSLRPNRSRDRRDMGSRRYRKTEMKPPTVRDWRETHRASAAN